MRERWLPRVRCQVSDLRTPFGRRYSRHVGSAPKRREETAPYEIPTVFTIRPDETGLRPRHARRPPERAAYSISVSSLNIGRYMLMITMPTMIPTPSIMIGSTIEVSDWIDASTSSS